VLDAEPEAVVSEVESDVHDVVHGFARDHAAHDSTSTRDTADRIGNGLIAGERLQRFPDHARSPPLMVAPCG
jgi:hypothetical protein